MRCGWDCGAELTGRNMRAHFTVCAKRPASSEHEDRRGRSLKVRHGRPPRLRMLCGWRCGTRGTGPRMRAPSPYARTGASLKPCIDVGLTRKPSVVAHQGGECYAPGAAGPGSRRAGCARTSTSAADAVRLALWDQGQRRRRLFLPDSSPPRTRLWANHLPDRASSVNDPNQGKRVNRCQSSGLLWRKCESDFASVIDHEPWAALLSRSMAN
jgi:hypothetical protein